MKRQIVQFHYTEWPDFGIPDSTKTIRELVRWMDLYRMKGAMAGLNGPVVTHCSAGVGRTGTFLAVHVCLEKMKYFNSLDQINIPRTVLLLRQSRSWMVQTAEQYQFIYDVLKDARDELREKAPRLFGLAVSPSSACDSLSSSSDIEATPDRIKHAGLKRSLTDLQISSPLAQRNGPPCSSENVMEQDRRKEKNLASMEKKRRLSFSTC